MIGILKCDTMIPSIKKTFGDYDDVFLSFLNKKRKDIKVFDCLKVIVSTALVLFSLDLVAKNTVDEKILDSLLKKVDISNQILGEVRQWFE